MSSGASLTSWGEESSLPLVGHPSSDSVTIKMPYGVDILHRPACTPSFTTVLVKTESGFIVRSAEALLGRWTLAVAVDAYAFLVFSDLTCHLEDTGYRNKCFLVALCRLIVRTPNPEVATKRILHQQVKIQG